jgi:hypothetical protein
MLVHTWVVLSLDAGLPIRKSCPLRLLSPKGKTEREKVVGRDNMKREG